MLGYVVTEKAELKVREYELYSAYYCGLCKTAGRRYGQLPRLALNYDFVFLALLAASIGDAEVHISQEHCIVHPLKKKSVMQSCPALEYASDIMVLLAYYKLKDDYYDNHSIVSGILSKISRPSLKGLFQTRPELCQFVESRLSELSALEKEQCPSLDQAAEPFARMMEEIFRQAAELPSAAPSDTIKQGLIFARIGYHLGKWIYLMDALDDIEENRKDGNYNPLIYRFSYDATEEPAAFRQRIREPMEYNLLFCLSEMGKAWELSAGKQNDGLISNIIYMGMLRKTELLLEKGNTTDEQSL